LDDAINIATSGMKLSWHNCSLFRDERPINYKFILFFHDSQVLFSSPVPTGARVSVEPSNLRDTRKLLSRVIQALLAVGAV